jgi:hypothetical protein
MAFTYLNLNISMIFLFAPKLMVLNLTKHYLPKVIPFQNLMELPWLILIFIVALLELFNMLLSPDLIFSMLSIKPHNSCTPILMSIGMVSSVSCVILRALYANQFNYHSLLIIIEKDLLKYLIEG